MTTTFNYDNAPFDIAQYAGKDTWVKVGTNGDQFSLCWTDNVCNEWVENYPTMSLALARFTALIHCGESGWEKGFSAYGDEFVAAADKFLSTGTG